MERRGRFQITTITCEHNIASALRFEYLLKPIDTVALFSPNNIDYLPICLAVAMCGSKLTPLNPLYTVQEMTTVLDRSSSKILFTHAKLLPVALEASAKSKSVEHIVVIPDPEKDCDLPSGAVDLAMLSGYKHSPNLEASVDEVHHHVKDVNNHPWLLPYSSGTTGLPKGVCLSHGNMIANLLQLDEVEGTAFPMEHKLISPLPFFHIYGFLASLLYCSWRGQELITTSDRFDLPHFCKLVEDHRPERAHLVPPIILGLAKHPIVDKYNLSSMKMIISAAAPLGKETENAAKKRLGTEVKQAWGMSELSPLGTMNSDYDMKTGSIGQLVSSTFGKIMDAETGKSLGPGEQGELAIKTANKVTDQQLKDWVRDRVAPQKRLDGGVIFIDQIPKSASGKILRRLLRDEAKKEFISGDDKSNAGEVSRDLVADACMASFTDGEANNKVVLWIIENEGSEHMVFKMG
eukprot:scaffold20186_cov71-Cyclotella_meneghiniana.AAC.2